MEKSILAMDSSSSGLLVNLIITLWIIFGLWASYPIFSFGVGIKLLKSISKKIFFQTYSHGSSKYPPIFNVLLES